MTTEQKLQLFTSYALKQAETKQEEELKQYETNLREELTKRKEQYQKERLLIYQKKEDQLKVEQNKKISDAMTQQRYEYAHLSESLTTKLFGEVQKEFRTYQKTEDYVNHLKEQIQSVQTLAGSGSYKIYLDASDRDFIPRLEKALKIDLAVAKRNLIGGMMAKLPDQNLLIDETIATKLNEAKESFTPLAK